jgi:hypothetical protein
LEFNRELHDRINTLEKRCLDFEDLKMDLEHKVLLMDRKLKVFDAFFEGQDSPGVRSMTSTVKRSSGRLDDNAIVFARAGVRTPSWSEHLHIPETEKPCQPKEEDGDANAGAVPLRSTSRSDSFLHRLLREKYGQGAVDGKSEISKSADETESAEGEKDDGKSIEKAMDGECLDDDGRVTGRGTLSRTVPGVSDSEVKSDSAGKDANNDKAVPVPLPVSLPVSHMNNGSVDVDAVQNKKAASAAATATAVEL